MNITQYCPSGASYCTLIDLLVKNIVNPTLLLLSGIALLVFGWGIVEFLIALSQGEKGTNEGKAHMLWGVVGIFIIVTAFGIFNFLASTVASLGR